MFIAIRFAALSLCFLLVACAQEAAEEPTVTAETPTAAVTA